MPPEDTKQRAGRIVDRTYYRRPDSLTWWKHCFALLALSLAVPLTAWLVVFLTSGRGASAVSPGRVAAVHATWEDRCEACHVPFQRIRSQDRCGTCHGGPIHFEGQTEDEHRCATCHNDHRGADASLVHLPDTACTKCHRNLGAVRSLGREPAFERNIEDLTRAHPLESRSVREFNPGKDRTRKFSHAVHMRPGLTRDPKNPRVLHFSDLEDPEEQKRYMALLGEKNAALPIQLECRACHQFDASGIAPLPISYAAHCRACHPLNGFDEKEPKLTVPHGMQPAKVGEFLDQVYAGRLLSDRLPLRKATVGPNGRLDRPELLPEARGAVTKLVESAEVKLATSGQGCAGCHLFDKPQEPFAKRTVRTPGPHAGWYQHARFTHAAHHAVSCRECHAGAYAEAAASDKAADELERVLVPETARCLECHGPLREVDRKPFGGAREECVECHLYHHEQAARPEAGAALREPKQRLDGESFRRGLPPGSDLGR